MIDEKIPGSFRDPGGYLFFHAGVIYRQVNIVYRENYDQLINSGLYKRLTDTKLLIPHQEVNLADIKSDKAYKIIRPEAIPFISYPYEWCFSQLRDAALTTLEVLKIALEFGMSLKDCSAYNIQFKRGRPILVDTLSFEKYQSGRPWVAYRQSCQHFLAPLALMSYRDIRLSQLFRLYIDGVPLDLASKLLPFYTRLILPLLSHIHLHAKTQEHFAQKKVNVKRYTISHRAILGLIDDLESAIRKMKWKSQPSEWINYYRDTNYSNSAFEQKKQLISEFLDRVQPRLVWDLGANIGIFSRIASSKGIPTISFDIDQDSVEKNYLECVKNNETDILPLLLDLANPSPAIGWQNQERLSLLERGPADAVFALALIHHLVISNNLPFDRIASFFNQICNSLIIEFVPKSDSQVQRMLATREDIFTDYNRQGFEKEFNKYFQIETSTEIRDSERILYVMQKRQGQ